MGQRACARAARRGGGPGGRRAVRPAHTLIELLVVLLQLALRL